MNKNRNILYVFYISLILFVGCKELLNAVEEQVNKMEIDIQNYEQNLVDKESSCQDLSTQSQDLSSKIEKSKEFQVWISTKIEQNTKKIQVTEDKRCKDHLKYIDFVKNQKVLKKLLDFLRAGIDKFSFAQIGMISKVMRGMQNEMMLLDLSKENVKDVLTKMSEIQNKSKLPNADDFKVETDAEKEKARTDEQIGDDHVDENREKIDVEDFETDRKLRNMENLKQELFNLIDELEQKMHDQLEERQNNEIEMNETVAAFIEKIEIDIQVLEDQLEEQQSAQVQMKSEIQALATEQEQCDSDVQELKNKIEGLKSLIKEILANDNNYNQGVKSAKLVDGVEDGSISVVVDGELASREVDGEQQEQDVEVVADLTFDGEVSQNNQLQKAYNLRQQYEANKVKLDNDMAKLVSATQNQGNQNQSEDEQNRKRLFEIEKNSLQKNDYLTIVEGQAVEIPPVAYQELELSFTWKNEEGATDNKLDGSIFMVNKQEKILDRVWWDKTSSETGSIAFKGEAEEEGNQGKEMFEMNLKKVNKNVESLFVALETYEQDYKLQNLSAINCNVYYQNELVLVYEINPKSLVRENQKASGVILMELFRRNENKKLWSVRGRSVVEKENIQGYDLSEYLNHTNAQVEFTQVGQMKVHKSFNE